MFFEGFDFTGFWEEGRFVQEYNCGPLTPERVRKAEERLGYQLPASYLWLMERQNGGIPVNKCFRTNEPTSWADDHIAIETILGVGDGVNDIVGETELMIEEWGYPNIGIAICDCPSAGHDEIFLDYRKCGPEGEPAVVLIDQEDDYSILHLADSFEEFVRGLENDAEFPFDDEEDG